MKLIARVAAARTGITEALRSRFSPCSAPMDKAGAPGPWMESVVQRSVPAVPLWRVLRKS
jgi:hypothetical protein